MTRRWVIGVRVLGGILGASALVLVGWLVRVQSGAFLRQAEQPAKASRRALPFGSASEERPGATSTLASPSRAASPLRASTLDRLEAETPEGRLTLAIRERLSDPEAVLGLVGEAESEFPESWHAAEWSKRKVDALLATGDTRAARAEADRLMSTYRGSPWALEVAQTLGLHPRQASR